MLFSCTRAPIDELGNTTATAFVPVYLKVADIQAIATLPSQPTINAGKIYVYNNYIFQNDVQTGFHIIKMTPPSTYQKVAFLKVPYSTEMAIKGNFLYCNNVSDLLVFDITNPLTPQLVNRVPNSFPVIDQNYPPTTNGFFECVDPSKGVIVNWEQKLIPTPKCRR